MLYVLDIGEITGLTCLLEFSIGLELNISELIRICIFCLS